MRSCLVCDDHPLVRDALAATIRGAWPDAEVLEAGDFLTAWRLAERAPDVCLLDLEMPGALPIDGLAALRRIAPDTPVLVVTAQEDDELLLQVLDAGVAGFASKASSAAVIEAAIRVVLAGGHHLPRRLVELARAPRAAATPARRAGSDELGVRFSDRQMEVLRRMASGLANKDIARELNLSPATVKTHVAHVITALGASNRTEATRRAQALGLI